MKFNNAMVVVAIASVALVAQALPQDNEKTVGDKVDESINSVGNTVNEAGKKVDEAGQKANEAGADISDKVDGDLKDAKDNVDEAKRKLERQARDAQIKADRQAKGDRERAEREAKAAQIKADRQAQHDRQKANNWFENIFESIGDSINRITGRSGRSRAGEEEYKNDMDFVKDAVEGISAALQPLKEATLNDGDIRAATRDTAERIENKVLALAASVNQSHQNVREMTIKREKELKDQDQQQKKQYEDKVNQEKDNAAQKFLQKRSVEDDAEEAKNDAKDGADNAGDKLNDFGEKVENGAKEVGDDIKDGADKAGDKAKILGNAAGAGPSPALAFAALAGVAVALVA